MAFFVLLSRTPEHSSPEIAAALSETGFSVQDHLLGSTPSVDFTSVLAAVIEVGARAEAALAQTSRWRTELGDEAVPIVWIESGPENATRGLEAGADVVLTQPVPKNLLIAQLRSAVRLRRAALRVEARAQEARLLGEQLRKAYHQLEREAATAQKLRRALLPDKLPTRGRIRFYIYRREGDRFDSDFYDVREVADGRLGFFLGDVVSPSGGANLIGVFAAQSVNWTEPSGGPGRGPSSSDTLLYRVNQKLLNVRLEDDPPLVAMLIGCINPETCELDLTRAALPAPIVIPNGEPARVLLLSGNLDEESHDALAKARGGKLFTNTGSGNGPFLGSAGATFRRHTTTLRPGDKLLMATDGARLRDDPTPGQPTELLEAAARHQRLSGQGFVEAIGHDLLTGMSHPEDFTLFCVEHLKDSM